MKKERYLISLEKTNEILSRSNYWNEVVKRPSGGSTNVTEVLWSELREVTNSLGLATLWILEDYALDLERRNNEITNPPTI